MISIRISLILMFNHYSLVDVLSNLFLKKILYIVIIYSLESDSFFNHKISETLRWSIVIILLLKPESSFESLRSVFLFWLEILNWSNVLIPLFRWEAVALLFYSFIYRNLFYIKYWGHYAFELFIIFSFFCFFDLIIHQLQLANEQKRRPHFEYFLEWVICCF